MSNSGTFSAGKTFGIIIVGLILVVGLIFSGTIVETINADEILCVQSMGSGDLTWHSEQGGWYQQWGGDVTVYQKRDIFEINTSVRFNDGGHGKLYGSIQYEMPLDDSNLTELHKKYGSPEAIKNQLIQTVVNKSVYMTGPLMSSKESYAEKRNSLIALVEDQITNGVYKTISRDSRVIDPITGIEKTLTIVEIVQKDGILQRQESPVLAEFGIRTFNFSIDSLPYDEEVERQIQQQQQITMDVQTAIADAKKAEQRAITVAEQGKADAAKAKWEQEVIKAKEVTLAEQKFEVAKLDAQAAEQYKRAQILRGEGDAAYKAKVMEADGALQQKLDTYLEVQRMYAEAIKDYQGAWVPNVIMGNNGATHNGAMPFIDLLTVKAAQDLGLDMNMGIRATKASKKQ